MLGIRTHRRNSEITDTDVSSVLVAVGGEQSDDHIVRLACELLNSNKDKLYILYVIEVDRGLPVDAEVASATAKAEEVLGRMEEVARSRKFKTEGELVQARQAGSAVVREAFDTKVDAIVLGIPYRERYGSFNMGETAHYVLENAPCRVILWRGPVSKNLTDGPKA